MQSDNREGAEVMANPNNVFRDISLNPQSTAVIVVDMENEFLDPSGKYYLGDGVKDVIDKNAKLLMRCRALEIPVIYIRSVRHRDDPVFSRFGKEPYLIEGTKGATIVDELLPREGEFVVEKRTHDCFYNTQLDQVLQDLNIKAETHHIVITGVASNVCVYHAAIGFHVRHFYSIIPMDCTIGTPGGNDIVISQLSGPGYEYNVSLTTSDRISFAAQVEVVD
jgi:nicotinamidase-related amidase